MYSSVLLLHSHLSEILNFKPLYFRLQVSYILRTTPTHNHIEEIKNMQRNYYRHEQFTPRSVKQCSCVLNYLKMFKRFVH